MTKKERLIDYYKGLVSALNNNGFTQKYSFRGEVEEVPFQVDLEHPNLTIMSITDDIDAYRFLKEKNLIKKDMCHFCGEMPVDGKYTFTEPSNGISINICHNCHPEGKHSSVNSGSGCMLSLIIPFLLIFSTLIIFVLIW